MADIHQTIHISNRMQILEKLATHRMEIEAIIRLLSNLNQEVTYKEIEPLLISQSQLMNAVLNP